VTQNKILLVSSDDVPGRKIVATHGLVRGNSVRARNIVRDLQAGLRTIVGGTVGVYAELLERTRDDAITNMTSEAEKAGANAVVALRLATSQVMGGAAEVVAYGTAVTIE
jgi:uncharacterized protein YbjQ (UPF0145 family)